MMTATLHTEVLTDKEIYELGKSHEMYNYSYSDAPSDHCLRFTRAIEQAILSRTPQPDAAAIREQGLILVTHLYWKNKHVSLHGYEFANCVFEDCTFDYQGSYSMRSCKIISTTLVEPAKNFCADCGQRNNGDLVHTCSPQTLDATLTATQDAPLAINGITRFAGLVLKAHRNEGYPGDVDGGTLQEYATECGLIEAREVNEPCGEGCTCAEMALSNDYPFTCYFNTDAGKLALAAASPTQSKDA